MKNLDKKSIAIGVLLPIIAIVLMGAARVLSSYHTIKAQEIELIDGEGNTLFSLSNLMAETEDIAEATPAANYDDVIASLKTQINNLSLQLNKKPKNDFISSGSFNEKVESIDQQIGSLTSKFDGLLKKLSEKTETAKVVEPKQCGSNCTKQCCANKVKPKQCGANCAKQCCSKPSSGPGNDKLDSEIAELRSEIELLGGALDSYALTDSEWSNKISRDISAIQSELQRISDNQDILMKILKKDIKKLKKK